MNVLSIEISLQMFNPKDSLKLTGTKTQLVPMILISSI